jgi:hypothetical protein
MMMNFQEDIRIFNINHVYTYPVKETDKEQWMCTQNNSHKANLIN